LRLEIDDGESGQNDAWHTRQKGWLFFQISGGAELIFPPGVSHISFKSLQLLTT